MSDVSHLIQLVSLPINLVYAVFVYNKIICSNKEEFLALTIECDSKLCAYIIACSE